MTLSNSSCVADSTVPGRRAENRLGLVLGVKVILLPQPARDMIATIPAATKSLLVNHTTPY